MDNQILQKCKMKSVKRWLHLISYEYVKTLNLFFNVKMAIKISFIHLKRLCFESVSCGLLSCLLNGWFSPVIRPLPCSSHAVHFLLKQKDHVILNKTLCDSMIRQYTRFAPFHNFKISTVTHLHRTSKIPSGHFG